MNFFRSIRNIECAVLTEPRQKLQIRSLNSFKLKNGQVLVKILYSGVCRSQLMEVQGKRGEDKWLPHLLGHEGSGVVVEIGQGVTKVKPGDEVILTWIKSDGIECDSIQFSNGNEIINSGKVTTFGNYSVVSENRLVLKPNSLSFKEAVLFGCALPTGAGMVFNQTNIDRESTVVILGLGGVGTAALMAAVSLNPKVLIALDSNDEKIKKIKTWGIQNSYNISSEFDMEEVKKLIPTGSDYCIESGGTVDSIELGFSLIRKNGGKLVFASHPPNGEKISIDPHEFISGKQIVGSWGGEVRPDRDIPQFAEKLLKSPIPLSVMLDREYSLEDVNKALDDLEQGNAIRPILRMHHGETI